MLWKFYVDPSESPLISERQQLPIGHPPALAAITLLNPVRLVGLEAMSRVRQIEIWEDEPSILGLQLSRECGHVLPVDRGAVAPMILGILGTAKIVVHWFL